MFNNTAKSRVIIIVIFLFIGICIVPSMGVVVEGSHSIQNLNGNTLYVGGGGANNYSKIQDAIDNATHGDTVFVFDDSSPYYENVVVDESIRLIGEDKDTTIIDGGGSGNVVSIFADEVTLAGFTMQFCGGTWSRAGIYVSSSDNTIIDNHIENNGNGIFLEISSYNNVSRNIVVNNGYHGIRVEYSPYNDIVGNKITNNEANGIYLWESSHTFIAQNTISDSYLSGILISGFSENNVIYYNNLINNRLENANDEWNNTWDNGYPSGGNYWDDYTGEDADGDGIGDTPYDIPGGDSQDRYPLMYPFGEIAIEIVKPEIGSIYIRNNKFIPFFTTIIIGNIEIEANAFEYEPGLDIERVEFYIDNNLKLTDTSKPYSWTWDELAFLRHHVKVVAYNSIGENASKEVVAWKFF